MKLKLILTTLFFTLILSAQNVNIPDPAFKAFLIDSGYDTNSDGEIQETEAQSATYMEQIHNIPSLISIEGISSFTNINSLTIFNLPQLASIDVSGMVNLAGISSMDLTALNSVNVTGCTGLVNFFIQNSPNITSLNFSGLTNLEIIEINGMAFGGTSMQLTSLNLTGCTALKDLIVAKTLITTLDVSSCINLERFQYADNFVPHLNLSGLTHLHTVFISPVGPDNQSLLSVNANGCTALDSFRVTDFEQLREVYIKNGRNESTVALHGCHNLSFVCVDEGQVSAVQTHLNTFGLSNVVCSSYCSFTPGGNYNTITGTVAFDANNDGCDASDAVRPNIKVNFGNPSVGSTFTNPNGNYRFYTDAGSFTWAAELENPTWFTVSPTPANTVFANNSNNVFTQNFCITANGLHPDLEIVIEPIIPASPGEMANYKIVYKNKGNQVLSGNVALAFDDSRLDFISAFPNVDAIATNSLSWSYSNLNPFESRSIVVVFEVNTSTETPAVNVGNTLSFTTTITPVSGDQLPSDNAFTYNDTVVGSAASNGITCLEGRLVPPSEIGKYLHYVVNFENMGTIAAENVVVKVTIDINKFDINSLQLLNTSAVCYPRITGNVAEFIFENINLSAATGNPRVGGHGDVLFKIRSKNTLVNGDQVSQTAKIYFDYDAPVNTNFSQTTYQNLSSGAHHLDKSIIIYPNPANSFVNITCNSVIKSIELYDMQGRLLETDLNDTTNAVLDISSKQNGIYFLKITSENGSKVEKIMKK